MNNFWTNELVDEYKYHFKPDIFSGVSAIDQFKKLKEREKPKEEPYRLIKQPQTNKTQLVNYE